MSDHTKGPRLLKGEYLITEPCGCGLTLQDVHKADRDSVVLCGKHALAPELLEALTEALHALMAGGDDFHPIVQSHCRRAIARASGKGV